MRNHAPLIRDVGVIGLVPDRWGDVWMPRHHVMTRLAHYFNVVWMDPPRGWRELWLSGVRPAPSLNADVPEGGGFRLFRPGRWLPLFHRPRVLAQLLQRARLRHATRLLRRAGSRNIVLYVWRPEFTGALDLLPDAWSCYHIDDEYSFSEVEQPLGALEQSLISKVDQVFIHSPALLEKKGLVSADTAFLPNGVDYGAYATPVAEPEDLRAIPHPRIGYVGVIKSFLDLQLLLELSQRHAEWSLVLVGPVRPMGTDREHLDALRQRPNVHLLGAKPVTALPAYMQHLDVGLMPYDVNDYTKFIYPLKLHEYLAAGIPVVGSPIRTLVTFKDVVAVASGLDEWSAAITQALEPATRAPERVASRLAVARAHDWDLLVHRIAVLLAGQVSPQFRDRIVTGRPAAPSVSPTR